MVSIIDVMVLSGGHFAVVNEGLLRAVRRREPLVATDTAGVT